jgi:phosphomannomutase
LNFFFFFFYFIFSQKEKKMSFLSFRGKSTPVQLAFGTSGLRGLVRDITDMEAYLNTYGFLTYASARRGETVFVAGDLRPSTPQIAAAVVRACVDVGCNVVFAGSIPTPALMLFAVQQASLSVMVTGSHIPFDRNGIKFNLRSGEVLKSDEAGILAAVAAVRARLYAESEASSIFADSGEFKPNERPVLPKVDPAIAAAYRSRYLEFFGGGALAGATVVFFQHSAVGRDLIVDLLRDLGATVHPAERSESFVPIDTEAISDERLADLQRMADQARAAHGHVDAIVSTDGDSDRPLVVGVDPAGRARFFGGDLLGVVVAEWLGATHVAVPISTNDCCDIQLAKRGVGIAKTMIGSPYVVRSMLDVCVVTPSAKVVGWEANGGFLVGSPFEQSGRTLAPLLTRDAVLPIAACLRASIVQKRTVCELFAALPARFSKASLLDNFARSSAQALLALFARPGSHANELEFGGVERLQAALAQAFSSDDGFAAPVRVDWTDGVRVWFANGDIAHIRPSGNAPQLRIYAVANTQERADDIVRRAVREPDGILRRLESKIGQ